MIPSGLPLYVLDFGASVGRVLKVAADNFTTFAGDVLVVDEGIGCAFTPGLDTVHWDGQDFSRSDLVNTNVVFGYEQATFAPASFDSQ